MTMKYIRKTYKVPAKRGARVRFMGNTNGKLQGGVIVGSKGPYLRIRLDGEKKIYSYHPTWELEYL